MAYGRVIVTAKGNVEHMEKTIRIGRREFSEKALLALLSGVAVTVSACGGGGDSASPSAPSAPNPPGDESGTISGNHGHVAEISAAQLATGSCGDASDPRFGQPSSQCRLVGRRSAVGRRGAAREQVVVQR